MKNLFLTCLVLCAGAALFGQLSPFVSSPLKQADTERFERKITPNRADYFEVADPAALASALAKAPYENEFTGGDELLLTLPRPDGATATFRISRYQMITDELQALYPSYVTATGWDVDEPRRQVYLEWTELGFGASVVGGEEGRWYISPTFAGQNKLHQSYFTRDFPARQNAGTCGFEPDPALQAELAAFGPTTKSVGDCQLREYRLALACTGEYYMAVGDDQALVVAEMMTAINRVNQVFRADLAIQLNIINLPDPPGTVQLVFDDPATDPYTNDDGDVMLDENQDELDATILTANYDIGHVFSTGGGGIAALGSPCNVDQKAQGVTGLPNPTGDPFYIDFVAHEFGHQFGGNHTFNSTEDNCEARNESTAYEPGSGTTIQAYAGICGPLANVQQNSDPYYHAISIQEISTYMEFGEGNDCATVTSTANTAPSVNAGADYSIPVNTPFVLTAVGSDGNGDDLTYCWEQFDLGAIVAGEPTGNEVQGPLFRSLPPVSSPERYFPALASVVSGVTSWESLPLVPRTMNFIVTARDVRPGTYGCTVQDEMSIDVINTTYAVTRPNGDEGYAVGSTQTVTWDAGTTAAAPISCTNVDIVLSTDGGATFDQVLATNVPNSGTATVTYPITVTTTARLLIRCNGNIFYDISDANFSLEVTDFGFTADNDEFIDCDATATEANFMLEVSSLQGFQGMVSLSTVSGLPAGATGTFTPTSVTFDANNADTDVPVNYLVSDIAGVPAGKYEIIVQATDGVTTKDITLNLVKAIAVTGPTDGEMLNLESDGSGSVVFTFTPVAGSTNYTVDLGGSGSINIGGSGSSITFGSPTPGNIITYTITANPSGAVSCPRTFSFLPPPPTQSLSTANDFISLCEGSVTGETYELDFVDGPLTGPADLTVTAAPAELNVLVSPATLNDGESATVSFTGEENLAVGTYTITIEADDEANTETLDLTLEIESDDITVNSPADPTEIVVDNGTITVPLNFDAYAGPGTVVAGSYTVYFLLGGNNFGNLSNLNPGQTLNLDLPADVGDVFTYFIEAELDNGDFVSSCNRTVSAVAVLPVDWLSFTARPAGKNALLNWSVAQDALNEGFAIERNNDGTTNWEQVGYVSRSGSDGVANYRFTDEQIAAGNTYHYRLRQEDSDGATAYSDIRAVAFDDVSGLFAVPNPANDFVLLTTGSSVQENLRYTLYDPAGRTVAEGSMNAGQARVNLSRLPPAIYQVLVTDGNDYREIVRIVKR